MYDRAERREGTAKELESKGIDGQAVVTRMRADVIQAKPATEAVQAGNSKAPKGTELPGVHRYSGQAWIDDKPRFSEGKNEFGASGLTDAGSQRERYSTTRSRVLTTVTQIYNPLAFTDPMTGGVCEDEKRAGTRNSTALSKTGTTSPRANRRPHRTLVCNWAHSLRPWR